MKAKKKIKLIKKLLAISTLFYAILSPVTFIVLSNGLNNDFSDSLLHQSNNSAEDSILWKLGKGIPGTGATMQPRLVNFTENGESLIIVGTDKGLAAITLDGFINMSYRTFGPVIDFDIIEDISGDHRDDIVLITYYKDHPNLIAIASNNASEIWKFKATVEGISTETYEKQDFITYTWDLEVINDINDDSISEIVIASWYRLIVVDGKVGDKIWMRDDDFKNDIWKVEVLEDINNNGFQTIIAGSEEGKLIAFDSRSGKELWTFKVEPTNIPVQTMFGISTEKVPNSIDDIKVINDVNNDEIDEILIAADDGYLRLISGKNGHELHKAICYNITQPSQTAPIYDLSTSPYTSTERLFRKSGVRLYDISDINDDGIREYMSIACDLDYTYKETSLIECKIFSINPEAEFELINISISRNWTYTDSDQGRFYSSDPEIINKGSEIQIYFYSVIQEDYESSGSARIERYHIKDEKSENPIIIYEDPDSYSFYRYGYDYEILSQSSTSINGYYLLNIGDVNFDGVNDLFAISPNGRYLCIDTKNDIVLWVRTRKDSKLDLTELKDLNNDGIKDLLIKQISNFEPDWISSNNGDSIKKPKIVSELYTIDGKTGKIIWSFNIPFPQYYEGIRDLKNVGDITDDGIDDYVGWVIPSIIPPDISDIIESLSEKDSYGGINGEFVSEDIYRALLTKYTKILAIDGSNGIIFWNNSLLGFPYRFYRQYGYAGSYEDPFSGYSSGNDFYNRINSEIPNSWGEYYNIDWNGDYNHWSISTLLHPEKIQLINGFSTDNKFDLWGDQGTNCTITSTNSSESSKSLKLGTTLNSTSVGTVESGDYLYWVLNSISSNGEHKINAELSFNLSQPIESELQNIIVDYEGFIVDDVIDQIDISIYNFSGDYWKKISTNVINDPDPINMVKYLNNINGLTYGSNKLVKIKLEATNASAFTLFIDKLVVNYTYTYKNYTITAEPDGSSWKAIMDMTIPIDFSNDNLLGVMEYSLSQIERFSALKLQTKLKVNTGDSPWYNFTYEMYDVSNSKWVLCNWSDTPTWNNHTYPDLKGGYGATRYDYKDFNFDSTYGYDHMWLATRGTNDFYPELEFDYENRTTLSNFIYPNKTIQIRLNVTNGRDSFNLTVDNFGIGAFYWGLFSSKFDRYYISEFYEESGSEFTTDNLLNLEIQDFDVVNGTNDGYLDIIAIIGNEENNYEGTWSTRIRLFDIKNKEIYSKWSLNQTYIPYKNVRILPINNNLNNWLISGFFQYGNFYNFSHKLIGNPHWNSQISHFDNYSDTKVEINYLWEEIPDFPEQYYYEFPGKTTISRDGSIGIILGEYEFLEEEWGAFAFKLSNIRIIDINNRSIVCKIPAENLYSLDDYGVQDNGAFDFSSQGAGYRLLISYDDFDGDNFLDHVGLYHLEGMEEENFRDGFYSYGSEIKIFSGDSGDSDPVILFTKVFESIQPSSSESQSPDKLTMPFTSIDDINNDEIPETIIGIQSGTDSCKGAYISVYDIYNSNEYEVKELTEFKWELDTFKCTSRWAERFDEFVFNIDKIGDLNADNVSEVFINRNYYVERRTEYGSRYYEGTPTTEILDIFNRNILYRFNVNVDSLLPIPDLNADGNKEILISSEEILYCINSKFGIQILSPKDQQSMRSYNFNIKWETESIYDYFEVLIDGVSQGATTAKNIHVSLGSGWREISIMLFDKSGLIVATSTINVLVPPNSTFLILTFVFLGVVVGLFLIYRRHSKQKEEMVLIEKRIKERGKKK
ncbi:MAG: PQQ-binding-like beta-propeller repeat protein [Promethearchaeota archaeon]